MVLTRGSVPAGLVVAAAWCWRILVVAGAFLALVALFGRLYLVFLPVLFAVLLSALLHPMLGVLRRLRFPRALATWVTVAVAFLVLAGVGWFVEQQAAASYTQLADQVTSLVRELRTYLERLPWANSNQLQDLQQRVVTALQQHTSTLANGVLTAGALAGELLTGLILTLFITFFFLEEGDRIWSWIVRLFPQEVQPSVRGAGYRAWHVLSSWVVGTAIISAIHGIVIGTVLVVLGVPLAVPLAVLVFVGSFIPLIGALLFGGLAVIVTLITQGVVPGLILLVVLLVENQLEAHLLQPFIVGRAVKLHPVAIVLALTAGGLLGGLFGAILAIPLVASAHAAVKYLTGIEDVRGNPRRGALDRMAPEPPLDYAPLPLYASPSDASDRVDQAVDSEATTVDSEDEGVEDAEGGVVGDPGPGAAGPGSR